MTAPPQDKWLALFPVEWNAALKEADRLHRVKVRPMRHSSNLDIERCAWLADSARFSVTRKFGVFAMPGLADLTNGSEKAESLMEIMSQCGLRVFEALLTNDDSFFVELEKYAKARAELARGVAVRPRLLLINLAIMMFFQRGCKNPSRDELLTAAEKFGIVQERTKGRWKAAFDKLVREAHLDFLSK